MNIFIVPTNAMLTDQFVLSLRFGCVQMNAKDGRRAERETQGELMNSPCGKIISGVLFLFSTFFVCHFLRIRFHCCQFLCQRQFDPLYQLNYMECDHRNGYGKWHQRVQSHAHPRSSYAPLILRLPINRNQSSGLIAKHERDFTSLVLFTPTIWCQRIEDDTFARHTRLFYWINNKSNNENIAFETMIFPWILWKFLQKKR